MKNKTAIVGWIAGIALATGCFLYFQLVVPYHVYFKEQIQLFVFSSSYIWSYFAKPAALARLGGDFLTQFFYLQGGGAVIITLLLITEWWLVFLTLKRFSVKGYALLWSLLPVAITWIYFPNPSFSVAWAVSLIITLSVFLLYVKARGKTAVALGIILIPVLYILAGASVFLFVILAILYEIHKKKKFSIFNFQFSILLALSLVLPFLLRHHYLLTLQQAYSYPYSSIKQGIIPDRKQENIFGIMIEAYHNNWDKVLEIAEKNELKSPVATCYTNIALSKKFLLGERLMDFYQPFTSGLLIPMVPGAGWFAIFSGSDAYYYIGDMGMAQHAAMLGMIFSPNQRSARMMERLVETNMATGDTAVAMKYMRILESTLFHKIKPDRLKNIPHRGIFKEDIIRSSNDIKTSLELLVASNPNNLPALNYLLSYYLLTKNIPAFFKAYTFFYKEKYPYAPKVYAEALLIYFAAKGGTIKDIMSYGIRPDIIKSFGEYTRLYEKSNGKLPPMQKEFPNTYWLFYHFAVMNNS